MGDKFGLTTPIDRIISEAHERGLEILLLGDQEAASLRKKIVAIEKEKVDQEFAMKKKQLIAERRIAKSQSINNHRMKKISKKYSLCQKIFEKVELELQKFANSKQNEEQYKLFLIQAIVDGLVRMFEQKIAIRCLQKDLQFFEELIPLCIKSYQQYMEEQVGIQYEVDLQVAKNMTLEQRSLSNYRPISKTDEDGMTIGGVILANETGNITFKATFDTRLAILKEVCLPDIRYQIWGGKQIQKND